MGVVQRAGNFPDHADRADQLDVVTTAHRQVAAGQVLHGDVMLLVVNPHVVHRNDVWVIKVRGDLGFTHETLAEAGVDQQHPGHDLQGNASLHRLLHCGVDHSHAAAAELTLHGIARNVYGIA